ncbi:MAG: cytochrome bc complex cytochrome b subunit [Anaerolineae bacterium]|nr:cytochrome bc complex cytochrome b subunit [Anaerolineae bacterium]MCO5187881.1 cytochrome bc complex cytochrome b subunit [Anaerolineae bacterium]MCO5192639.1 cytochrome bc complex cytochrome b subunit [Anaerolineae bacterium]MCO5197849.1 cytochrome bc complex cytochrome b subunit [Anaerolineae bacterium]MCO5205345.1 cytochrome bc complex cytochrome b subunit [Anaerolineae bacterium]
MATFFEQVREMGVKQATIAKTDEIVERMTAGMNINDIRSALRGEEARRPNPRLRPHADGFWFHIRPSFYHAEVTHIYPTFRLGWLSTFMFVWETITGIFLMVFYTPSPRAAYSDLWNIMGNVPLGQLVRNLHRFGAEMMVLVVALHMLRTFITGSYKKPRQFTWLTGMLLLCLTLILSFSGYLLPWDQLAYWAVTVAVSATSALPIPAVARTLDLLVRGGPAIGEGGLLRFYLLHVLALPLITGIFIFVHYYKVVLHGHSLPPGREAIGEDTAKRVPKNERVYFTPDIFTSEVMWTALVVLILIVGSYWFAAVPIEHHANPQITPLHVVAPWYLSWSQGWLKLAHPFIVAFVFIPGLATIFFIFPYLEVGKSRRYADRRVGLSVGMLFIAFMLVSNWMGSPKYKVRGSSDQEVAQEIMPQEGHSPILETPFEALAPGIYYPGQETENEHFNEALHEYFIAMDKFSCKLNDENSPYRPCEPWVDESGRTRYRNWFTEDAMPDPGEGVYMQISDQQETLRRIDLIFQVVDPESSDGALLYDSVSTWWRHEDSNYENY